MTAKADFTEAEWKTVLEGPPTAGMIVVFSGKGGTFRETLAMGKAYAEARQQHGASELLDAIATAKPSVEHSHSHSLDELKTHGLAQIRDAVAVLEQKATPEEVDDYRKFVVGLAERVASAHREDGVDVSPGEQAAISDIQAALGMAEAA
jgi:anion-transporting  ArsA/GET3 family ATPase